MAAGHFRLGSLVAIVDRNQLSIDGATEDLMGIEPLAEKFTSFRWKVQRVDGHDLSALLDAFDALDPPGEGPPQVIIADTIKGRGVQRMEGDIRWHVGNLVGADYDDVMAELQPGPQPLRARGRRRLSRRRAGSVSGESSAAPAALEESRRGRKGIPASVHPRVRRRRRARRPGRDGPAHRRSDR